MSNTTIICPTCQTRYDVPSSYIGEELHCRCCGCDFTPDAPAPEIPAEKQALSDKVDWEQRSLPRPATSVLLNVIAALVLCSGIIGAILAVGLFGFVCAVVLASVGLIAAGIFWGLSEIIHFLARLDYNVKEVRKNL